MIHLLHVSQEVLAGSPLPAPIQSGPVRPPAGWHFCEESLG